MEEHEEEKTYEVKDKRRVNPDGSLKEESQESPPASEEPTAGQTPEAEEISSEEAEAEFPLPSVYDLLQFIAGLLSEQAWVQMGIRVAPGQKEAQKDPVQAKIAIDTVAFIADKLHPHVGDEERKALRALISDLQINFVRLGQ